MQIEQVFVVHVPIYIWAGKERYVINEGSTNFFLQHPILYLVLCLMVLQHNNKL